MNAELLAHPDIVSAIDGITVKGLRLQPQDRGDAVAEVQMRVLYSLRNRPQFFWPQTLESWKALAIRTAQTTVFDRTKKARRRRKTDAGPCEDPTAHAALERRISERDPLDQKLALKLVGEHLAESKDPEKDLEIIDRLAAGEKQDEIAEAMGMTHQQLRDRVRAIRQSLRIRLVGAVGPAVAATFALLLIIVLPGRAPRTRLANQSLASAPEVVTPEATPMEVAAYLREQAREVCAAGTWDRCITLLDDAAELDPKGDLAPEVQAARDAAAQNQNDDLRQYEVKPPQPPKRH